MFRKLFVAVVGVVGLVGAAGDANAGAVNGSGSGTHKVNANATSTHQVAFKKGERAVVSIIGDGDTDLDVEVFDAQGNLVASDYNLEDVAAVKWVPPQAGVYTIKIINRGGVWNRCILTYN